VPVAFDSGSPDDWESETLGFRLEILDSDAACGYGNVTLDGQVLPQTFDGEVSKGQGSITTDRMSILVASWSFHCIKVNGQPEAQFMKFLIDFVDGKSLQDTGFSVLFRQTDGTEIMNIETDMSIPDHIVANPDPEGLRPIGEDIEFPQYTVEDDLAELDYLYAQLRELHYLIAEKERAVAEHDNEDSEEDIKDCDSLKCIVKTVADQARNAAHVIYSKLGGDEEEHDGEFGHFPKPPHFKKPHFKKPHFKKPHFKKPHFPSHPPKGGKNHTCGGPKHGNHTHGNHTHPPHHRKPHFPHHRLPICRYPPPGRHPHHPPPHHPPPPHHGPPHGKPPGGEDRWRPGPPQRNGPGKHRPDFHHGPDMDDEPLHGSPEDSPRPFPSRPHHGEGPPDHAPPPPPDFNRPPPPPHHGEDGPPPPPTHHERPPPPPEEEQEFMEGPPPGEKHHRPGPPPGPPPHHRNRLGKVLAIVKFTSIGFLFAFLLVALHRRTCTPEKRRDRASRRAFRREHREKRRAYRRAVHKHAITKLLARISGNGSGSDDDDFDDFEEKRQSLLSDAEDGMSTTMTEDITQLRNAADVVGDIVAAEEVRSEPMPILVSEDRPLMQDFEIGSQVGDGEELPAYEDNDGSEMSSMIADGFRYTPGSSDYSPSHSPAGSVGDILGPDTKN
jgi:hypothetical protein